MKYCDHIATADFPGNKQLTKKVNKRKFGFLHRKCAQ